MTEGIDPRAVVDPTVKIGKNVVIEPYAIVKGNAILHDNVVIKSHAYIDGHTEIGKGSVIWPFACIGTKTQDKKFKGERTYVRIGKHTEIREYVTINASCGEETEVVVGDYCLIMAYCHIAHNCIVGNHVIMSNNSTLAGHVTVEDFATIGGMTPIHQFVRIGKYAMVGGMSRVTKDVPPFTIGGGAPYKLGGLNIVGLKRHKFSFDIRKNLTRAFKLTYRNGLTLQEAIEQIQIDIPSSEQIDHWVEFCKDSKRGLICMEGITRHILEEDKEGQDQELLETK
ncbi:MAG: acyl-ACP--UDP-N-acetylglucosamine O-acyltransferase [Chlamydiae bacterium]|nr:acyl-ACP--UDP-N-acetylglucosamine O-acyltransferase [Chlamydiota bacterium]